MKKSRLFYKIFIQTLLTGVILVSGFCFYIFNSTYESVFQALLKDKQNYTTQIRNYIDERVQNIERAFVAVSTSESFKKSMNSPLDYKDYLHIREVNSELNYIALMGADYTDYSLVSLNQGWKIEGNTFTHLNEKESINYNEYIKNNKYSTEWHSTSDGIEMTLALPLFSEEKFALGIAEIKKRILNPALQDDKEATLYIYDRNGMLLFTNRETEGEYKNALLENSSSKSSGIINISNDKYLIFETSPHTQWILALEFNNQEVKTAMSGVRNGLLFVYIVLIFIISMISYFLAMYYSRPISKIQKHLLINHAEGNEFDNILERIDDMVMEKEELHLALEKQKDNLELLFTLNLYRDYLRESEVENKYYQFGYTKYNDKTFAVVMIQIDDYGRKKLEENVDTFLMAVNFLVLEIVPLENRLLPIVLNAHTQTTVFSFDRTTLSEDQVQTLIYNYCEQIRKKAQELFSLTISFGISPEYQLLSETRDKSRFAREALQYGYNLKEKSIIFYNDIPDNNLGSFITYYPGEKERDLFDKIRLGNLEETKKSYQLFMKDILSNNPNPFYLKIIIAKFISNVIELSELFGVKFDFFEDNDSWQDILNNGNVKNIMEILYINLIVPLVNRINDNEDRDAKSISGKMIEIIHRQYDQDISLETIGEELHYNPVYLSRAFKEEYGENFLDYLQNYRIEIAQEWLLESNITVKAIAEKLRYTNSQNFIRFFKNKNGITPGEYRRRNKKI